MNITTEQAIRYKELNEKEGLKKLHRLTDSYMDYSMDTTDPYDAADNISYRGDTKYANEVKNRNIPHNKYKDPDHYYSEDGETITVLLEDKKKRGLEEYYSDATRKYFTFYNDGKYISFNLNNIDWEHTLFKKDYPCEQSSSEMITSGHSHKVPKDVWMLPLTKGKIGDYGKR